MPRIFSVRNIFYVIIMIKCSLLLLDVFKFDPEYLVNEDKYKQIRDGKEYESLLFLYGSSILDYWSDCIILYCSYIHMYGNYIY